MYQISTSNAHGNCKDTTNPNHIYVIVDDDIGEMMKVGIIDQEIPATDIVISDNHKEFKIERKYESVNTRIASLGRCWTTNFEGYIYLENKFVNVLCTDAHVETLNEIDGVFVNDKVGATIYTLIKTLQNMNMM
ncbi:DUF6531 domain-containing protein [Clostridium estertheticum]|uniref:DUF6531 domain-containing protein n=1 Tax=Clostridium estertheticum TaxID=238834 RepID=UPI001CF4C8FC|nr:hypothetical protein [Clostridium estertheticum]MCB2362401.1 hypothetical protein [Clostridium estertheticum]